jgi:hypothetical protein
VRRALNISFNFASGNPVTIPSARYVTVIGGKTVVVEEFDEVNNFRLPATHHLDVSYEKLKQHRRVNTRFVIGVYNLYNQLNPFMVYIGLNELGEPVLKLRSYLPLMPMIKYHIQF